MIKKSIIAFMLLLGVMGCQDIKYPEKPDNLIDSQTMVSIYTDSYLANASKRFNRTILLRNGVDLETYIYKKYKVDSAQFANSNAFYTNNFDLYRDIMLQVTDSIDLRLQEVDSVIEVEKKRRERRRDSLRKIAEKRRDSLGEKIPDSLLSTTELQFDSENDTVPITPKKTIQAGTLLQETAKDSVN